MITIKVSKRDLNIFRKDWWRNTRAEWAPKLLLENQKNWPLQVDFQGRPWKSLTPNYEKWKRSNYGSLPILRITGRMLDTANIEAKGDKFMVESTELGPYHQFGTKRMVARPWMGVPDKSLNILAEIALKHIVK